MATIPTEEIEIVERWDESRTGSFRAYWGQELTTLFGTGVGRLQSSGPEAAIGVIQSLAVLPLRPEIDEHIEDELSRVIPQGNTTRL